MLPLLNIAQLLEEDKNAPMGTPLRYGYAFDVDLSLDHSGEWTALENGDRLWRLTIKSEDALALFFNSNAFYLPSGSKLFVYNDNIIVEYTSIDNKSNMSFSSSSIRGDIIHLEYYEPYSVYNEGILSINSIIHNYKDIFNISKDSRDNECGYDVSEYFDSEYIQQINATAMLDMANGYVCSGALLNNERENQMGYFLTAWHCIYNILDAQSISNIKFYFDYITDNNYGNYATDAILLNHSDGMNPDYALMLIQDFSRLDENTLCYAGWDASNSTPDIGFTVHHPAGQSKKINFDDDIAFSWDGTLNWADYGTSLPHYHWRVKWDDGLTAGGSSGSGLFNDQGLLVGQLSGGNSDCTEPIEDETCTNVLNENDCLSTVGCEWYDAGSGSCIVADPQDFYGKFSHAFDDISQWLDPLNTNITSIEGLCVCDDEDIPDGECDCNGNIFDVCGVCDGPGPTFECIDSNGAYQGIFCSEELCNQYTLDTVNSLPAQVILGQNYPNPFNPKTTIEYGVPTLANTNISLYDLQGRKLKTLINSMHSPGYYTITLNLNDFYSGIYLVKITSGSTSKIRKIALVK